MEQQIPHWLNAAVEAAGMTTVYNADDWKRIAEKVRFQRDPGDTAANDPSAAPH
jgi:hypothetical protein